MECDLRYTQDVESPGADVTGLCLGSVVLILRHTVATTTQHAISIMSFVSPVTLCGCCHVPTLQTETLRPAELSHAVLSRS